MELTEDRKDYIDSLSYESLLRGWRNTPAGDTMFLGETGTYWRKRMGDLRDQGANHVQASKNIGWEGN